MSSEPRAPHRTAYLPPSTANANQQCNYLLAPTLGDADCHMYSRARIRKDQGAKARVVGWAVGCSKANTDCLTAMMELRTPYQRESLQKCHNPREPPSSAVFVAFSSLQSRSVGTNDNASNPAPAHTLRPSKTTCKACTDQRCAALIHGLAGLVAEEGPVQG